MKILQINSVCGIRSTGRICTDIADILKANGHECMIAYGREYVPEKYKDIAVRIGTDTGVKFDGIKTRIFDNAGFNSKAATKKFIEWVREYDPDIVHLHNIHGYYINIEILFDYLKTANKPVIWTLHDCWSMTGHCAHFDYIGCDKWESGGCNNCPQKGEYPRSLFLDRSKNNFDRKKNAFTGIKNLTFVTPSEWLSGIVKRSYLKDYPVKVINNGIDLDVFKPTESDFIEKYGLGDKKIVLGVASAWGEKKGLYDFIKLSELLDDEYKVVLVGLTEEQKAGLPQNILGITRTNNVTELAEIYSAADVFINPSYEETMGLTTVEALACGTPAVVYDRTAVPEVVDENSGTVIEAGNIETLFSALKFAEFNNVDCINRAKSFEKATKFSEYLNLYEEILNENPFYHKRAVTI